MNEQAKPHVVIVGAGFGGLWTARALARKPVRVTLIDQNNYHSFWPLLYQVAAAEVAPEQIAYPVRAVLRRERNIEFLMAEATALNLDSRIVHTDQGDVYYDYLVLALGSTSAFFGIPGAERYTFPLKNLDQGIALRNHILRLFECASLHDDPEVWRELLTFVVVGGGPTGVEFAGALQELIHGPLCRDFPELLLDEGMTAQVIVVEMLEGLLGGMEEKLGKYALKRLERMGVEVRTGTAVTEVTPQSVHLKDGSLIPTQTVIWTAGVRGHPLVEMAGLPMDRGKRVAVEPTLQVPERPNVFVIGDLASYKEGEDERPLPMLAPVATQQGKRAAANILKLIEGQTPEPFTYQDRGTMATVGRNAAVAEIFGFSFTGYFAWLTWLAVHLFNLIGFRNRLIVLLNWAWTYLFYEHVVRLILPEVEAPQAQPVERT